MPEPTVSSKSICFQVVMAGDEKSMPWCLLTGGNFSEGMYRDAVAVRLPGDIYAKRKSSVRKGATSCLWS
jgi:hypothetical protein